MVAGFLADNFQWEGKDMNRSVRPKGEASGDGCPTRSQAFVEAVEGWKKCTIATFGWLALVIAVAVALIIELGAVKRVWGEMFSTDAQRSAAPRAGSEPLKQQGVASLGQGDSR